MKNMKLVVRVVGTLGLVGCAVLSSPLALAEDGVWYGGGSMGQTWSKIDDARITNQLLGAGFTSTTISSDNSDIGYKLFGGYKYNENIAFEGGYFNLGKFAYTATTAGPAGTMNGNIKLDGINLDGIFSLPISGGYFPFKGKLSVFSRIGLQYADARDNFSGTGAVTLLTNPSPYKRELSYKYGLGMQYDFNESLGMRAEAERYRINDAIGNHGDINMFSLGLVYRFGKKQCPVATPAHISAAAPVMVVMPVVVPVKVKTQQYCSILDFTFEIKQDEMQREEKEKLGVLGTFMKKYPDTTALIEGHTDNVGAADYNMALSERRAQSVVTYMIDTFKIDPSRLTAVGYGETRPINGNNTREERQENRRINAVVACAPDIAGLKVAADRLTMALEIQFEPHSAEIDPTYAPQLQTVANFMNGNPTVTATVEGFAGRFLGVGSERETVSPEEAMTLSEQRAQAVVDYLVNELGIPRARLSTAAFGSTRRVSYGTTLDDQQQNRRINIIYNYQPAAK